MNALTITLLCVYVGLAFLEGSVAKKIKGRLWKKNATGTEFQHREYGYVYYDVTPYIPPYVEGLIRDQIRYLNSLTCMKWWPVYPWETLPSKVTFVYDYEQFSCYHDPEVKGDGLQIIRLGERCVELLYEKQGENGLRFIIMHLMMRAMSMYSETQRGNRDCYLRIPKNVSDEVSLRPFPHAKFYSDFPYDTESITQIPEWVYGEIKSTYASLRVGRTDGSLSRWDIMKLEHIACGGPSYCQSPVGGLLRPDGQRQRCHNILVAESQIGPPCNPNPIYNITPTPYQEEGAVHPGVLAPVQKLPQGVCRIPVNRPRSH